MLSASRAAISVPPKKMVRGSVRGPWTERSIDSALVMSVPDSKAATRSEKKAGLLAVLDVSASALTNAVLALAIAIAIAAALPVERPEKGVGLSLRHGMVLMVANSDVLTVSAKGRGVRVGDLAA